VQATLLALTVRAIAGDVPDDTQELLVCGGGALNEYLLQQLQAALAAVAVMPTDARGLPAMQVEAAAFAWLAMRLLRGLPGNLPAVTGAAGPRLLGSIYPA
jgi:anhydro-N-acetylmuramic acid kinase